MTFDDQTKNIWELSWEVLGDDCDNWMNIPNSCFEFQPPKNFIGTDKEQILRDSLLRVKYGIFE